MANFSLRVLDRHNPADLKSWLQLHSENEAATLFHSPTFLGYHGTKFAEHHLGLFKGNALFAVMPLATFEVEGEKMAKSPYGGSYGSFLFSQSPRYGDSRAITDLLTTYLVENGIKRLLLTPPIRICEPDFSDTFNFSLLESGFKIVNSDISSVVPLQANIDTLIESKTRNKERKAVKAQVRCEFRVSKLEDFWKPFQSTQERLNSTPTHTFEQWKYLSEVLPKDVWVDVAYLDNLPIAGIAHFRINRYVDSSFYLCYDENYRDIQALTLLIIESLKRSFALGFRWFDFGTSSVHMIARENIFSFKENFGAIGVFRNTFENKNIQLRSGNG